VKLVWIALAVEADAPEGLLGVVGEHRRDEDFLGRAEKRRMGELAKETAA
jgi:hypothetical protein